MKHTTDTAATSNSGETVVKTTSQQQRSTPKATSTPIIEKTGASGTPYVNDGHKLTRKQKAFADKLLENPKQSATQAVAETYNVKTRRTAEVMASENLRKPEILAYLHANAETAENTVLDVMNYSRELGKSGDKSGANYASVALASAKEVLDRVHGKSVTKIHATTKAVVINVDLTGVTD